MRIRQYQLDAFTDRVFGGNPAAVCLPESWLPPETMQAIAAENNLSETVFCVPDSAGYGIRWFTPRLEIGLAGHPTLAAAWVILHDIAPDREEVRFTSKDGEVLTVVRDGIRLVMDFPAVPASACDLAEAVCDALGAQAHTVLQARDTMAIFACEAEVRTLTPDMNKISALDTFGVIATAPGEDCDFVSRFFAPRAGIPEDPVTGSAHCTLTPYWAKTIGKSKLFAKQISERGGELQCEHQGDRVRLGGTAVPFMEGIITLP
jgi:PhzF family phenazine biosynthesis protein